MLQTSDKKKKGWTLASLARSLRHNISVSVFSRIKALVLNHCHGDH